VSRFVNQEMHLKHPISARFAWASVLKIRGVHPSKFGQDRTGLDRGPNKREVMDRGPDQVSQGSDRDRTEKPDLTGPNRQASKFL